MRAHYSFAISLGGLTTIPLIATARNTYKKLHCRIRTDAHDFQFWYFAQLSEVLQNYERPYSDQGIGTQTESFPLFRDLSIWFISNVIKRSMIFL